MLIPLVETHSHGLGPRHSRCKGFAESAQFRYHGFKDAPAVILILVLRYSFLRETINLSESGFICVKNCFTRLNFQFVL